ncbi:hypothetical protein [Streptomyces hydrogenans]|uniref:hypothetical protein n=1 Tax=Streptomyces hydrogenans TaxID=1873719 RepID=UPI0034206ED0
MTLHDPAARSLTDAEAKARAQELIHEAFQPAPLTFRDPSPTPAYGDALPVAQPGRPPMSQGATDASVLMLAGAGSVSLVSVSVGVLMYLSQYADPVVCGVVLGAPTVVVLALCRLVTRAKETVAAAPPVIHQHYQGPVHQDHRSVTTTTTTKGVFARTRTDVRK